MSPEEFGRIMSENDEPSQNPSNRTWEMEVATGELLEAADLSETELYSALDDLLNQPEKDKNDIRTDELLKEHSQFEETVDSTANYKKQNRNSHAEDTKNKEQCHVCLRTVNKPAICVNCKQKCYRKCTEPDTLCLFEPWICKKCLSTTRSRFCYRPDCGKEISTSCQKCLMLFCWDHSDADCLYCGNRRPMRSAIFRNIISAPRKKVSESSSSEGSDEDSTGQKSDSFPLMNRSLKFWTPRMKSR